MQKEILFEFNHTVTFWRRMLQQPREVWVGFVMVLVGIVFMGNLGQAIGFAAVAFGVFGGILALGARTYVSRLVITQDYACIEYYVYNTPYIIEQLPIADLKLETTPSGRFVGMGLNFYVNGQKLCHQSMVGQWTLELFLDAFAALKLAAKLQRNQGNA